MDTEKRLRWINCEHCGGTGEIIKGGPDPIDEYATICPDCEGTGRDCAEEDDDELPNCVWRNADTPFADNH